ncbi:MAG: TPM domain-containing protein, partial [Myxococcaceae bacterium]
AEAKSSGEVRVSVAPFFWGDVRRAAERAFERLGMTATRERNGVLFFVVPSRHRLVVLGDAGAHQKAGQAFWDEVAAKVTALFREGDFTGGLVLGIDLVGDELARHFPSGGPRDVNELPDRVDFGPSPPP